MRKILIVHHFSEIGGAGRSLIQNAKILSENFQVFAMIPGGSPMEKLALSEGLNVVPYSVHPGTVEYYSGGPKIFSRTYFLQYLRRAPFKREVLKNAEKLGIDILVLNSITLSYLLPDATKYNPCCFVRETFPEGGSARMLRKFRQKLNCAKKVFFISEFDRGFFDLHHTQSVVVRNTIPDNFFEKIPKNVAFESLGLTPVDNAFYVLYLGGMQELKGASLMRSLIPLLNNSNVKFLMCGDDAETMKNYFGEGPIYLGKVTDMRTVYSAADCLIFPSSVPHQARPIFEAGAFKIPVIISDFPQTAEYIKNGVNGVTFTPGNVNELSKIIENLASNRSLVSIMGNKNFELTVKNHKVECVRDSLSKEIQSL